MYEQRCPSCGSTGPFLMIDMDTYYCPSCGTTFTAR